MEDPDPAAPAPPQPGSRRPRRTAKLAEVVAHDIVQDITSRGLAPQTSLPSESVMAVEFSVGRTTLREALRLLEVQGILHIRPGPGGGPVVGTADSEHFARMATLFLHLIGARFKHLVQARLVLEPVMVRLAAERQDPDDMARLRAYLDEPAPGPEDDLEYLQSSTGFHSLLMAMSGNPALDLIARALKDIYTERVTGAAYDEADRAAVHAEHVAIARAVLAGNSAAAERRMRAHMTEWTEKIEQRFPGLMEDIVYWAHP